MCHFIDTRNYSGVQYWQDFIKDDGYYQNAINSQVKFYNDPYFIFVL